jgi:molybdate transport system substrate-binding protein
MTSTQPDFAAQVPPCKPGNSRSGFVMLIVLVAAFVMILLLMMQLKRLGKSISFNSDGGTVRLACAASMKVPVEQMIADFSAETGIKVEVQYGGSGTLLSQLRVAPNTADLYLAADMSYLQQGRDSGLIAEILPLAWMQPVLAVPAGNPLKLQHLEDLLASDVRFGLANPEAAAIGRIVRDVMQQLGSWQEFESLATVFKPTMPELANDLKLGTLDAAILWDATVAQHEELAAIALPEFAEHSFLEAVGVLKNTEQPALALQFARYMQAQDRGALTITRNGFRAVGGDRWQAVPKLTLFAGSMLNRAVDQAIHEFSAREGVQITRVYNGCGILVGQMRAGAQPDAYFSCDQSFLDQVADRFQTGVTVSQNPIMLITAKDNPHQIDSLADLLKPGLRVGLAHPEKSALGFLTRRLLQQVNLEQPLIDSGNIKQETPQGDLLVSAMATGSLDAIVVYKSNAMGQSERFQMHTIDSELALASQPYAVALDSKYPHTMQRLFDALTSAATQQRFEDLGFVWLK